MVINIIFKKEYLKEFLISFFGNKYPIQAESNILGKLIKPLLERPPGLPIHIQLQKDLRLAREEFNNSKDVDENIEIANKIERIKSKIDSYKNGYIVMIKLPKYSGFRLDSMNYISLQNQRFFESIVHDLFKEIFFNWVDAKIEAGFTKTDAINHFCYRYEIPLNAMNFEMLKKKYDRYEIQLRIEKNVNKNVTRMSRNLSRQLTTLNIAADEHVNIH